MPAFAAVGQPLFGCNNNNSYNLRVLVLQNELREVPRAWNLDLC
jgi:hypothetical protein